MTALSVLTVTHNRCELLRQKLAALGAQTLPPERFELVVLANGCTDETLPLLQDSAPAYRLQVLESPSKLGPAAARNRCAQAARGRVLYFSDDDCLPDPETLAKHLAAQAKPCVAIGGLTFTDGDTRETWRPRRVGFWNLNGANSSVPAAAFRAARGFDETLSGYGGEDVALGYALSALPFVALPDAGARHLGPNPVRSGDLYKARSAGRNAVRLASRYPELAYRLGVHPALLALKRLLLRPGLRLGPTYRYERAYLEGALEERRV